MQDPHQGIFSMVYRPIAIEIFNTLLNYCLNDGVMYNRLRQLLTQDHPTSTKAFENLVQKAETSGYDLTTILEVYNRGFNQEGPSHLTSEQ